MQSTRTLILDACCLLNLYATDRLREIAMALPYQFVVADYVLEREALYVWLPDSIGGPTERIHIDVSPLVAEGLITVVRLEHPEEEALFVDLAASVDDGEAVTGALALCRGYLLATDDRKARRILSEHGQGVGLVSTLELVKSWAEAASITDSELRHALEAIRSGASYVPGERDPHYEWWQELMYGRSAVTRHQTSH